MKYQAKLNMKLEYGIKEKLSVIKINYSSYYNKINKSIQTELEQERQENSNPLMILQEKQKTLKTFITAINSLDKINSDIEIFSTHLSGTDLKLIKSSEYYIEQFNNIKEQIEIKLNNLLRNVTVDELFAI